MVRATRGRQYGVTTGSLSSVAVKCRHNSCTAHDHWRVNVIGNTSNLILKWYRVPFDFAETYYGALERYLSQCGYFWMSGQFWSYGLILLYEVVRFNRVVWYVFNVHLTLMQNRLRFIIAFPIIIMRIVFMLMTKLMRCDNDLNLITVVA